MKKRVIQTILILVLITHNLRTALAEYLDQLPNLIEQQNVDSIKSLGPKVLNELVKIYRTSDVKKKTKLAAIFYQLGWKSEAAKEVLIKDIKTEDQALRLQVQWALGRVSNDQEVVDGLLENMRNDPNPLFRDKAACALAHDQIHLTEQQKIKLYQGVIAALSDPKQDVRRIASLVMQIRTGQNKGYNSDASLEERNRSIAKWESWLAEYKNATANEE